MKPEEKLEELLRLLATRLVSSQSAESFFLDCIDKVARFYDVQYAFIGLLDELDKQQVNTYLVWHNGKLLDNFEYSLPGTPCEDVINLRHEIIRKDASCRYPDDNMLAEMKIESYFGSPLIALDGDMLGLFSIMDSRPMHTDSWMIPVLNCVATRFALEIERTQTDQELRSLNHRLMLREQYDPITGILNREALEHQLSRLKSGTSGSDSHAFIYIDLDQFRLINDTAGHTAGDELLRQAASLFKKNLHSSDILGRLGGDEFAVILENYNASQAISVAEKLRESLADYRFFWSEKPYQFTASIGVSLLSSANSNEDILAYADMACNFSKENGRNRVHMYIPDDSRFQRHRDEMLWVSKIKNALESHSIELHSQSILPLQDDCPYKNAREILVRIRSEDGEIFNPGQFIPPAEKYGIMDRVDYYVVMETLDWISEYTDSSQLVTINMSGQSLSNEALLNSIEDRLIQLGENRAAVCFEITETSAILDIQVTLRFMNRFKKLGVHFALDDFGSGLSSFGYLKGMPVDFVKIDGMFVKNMEKDATDASMVEAINRVAKAMNIRTIAEHVTNNTTLSMLTDFGVDYAQGYHIARPDKLSG